MVEQALAVDKDCNNFTIERERETSDRENTTQTGRRLFCFLLREAGRHLLPFVFRTHEREKTYILLLVQQKHKSIMYKNYAFCGACLLNCPVFVARAVFSLCLGPTDLPTYRPTDRRNYRRNCRPTERPTDGTTDLPTDISCYLRRKAKKTPRAWSACARRQ